MNDDYYLDEEKEEEIGECFRMFDKDKDGYRIEFDCNDNDP